MQECYHRLWDYDLWLKNECREISQTLIFPVPNVGASIKNYLINKTTVNDKKQTEKDP